MQIAQLRETVDRVIDYTMTRQLERTSWEKASAISGMLAWQNENAHAVCKRWMDRAIAMQTTAGYLHYGDREEYPHGHAKVLTPTASVSSMFGYPLLLLYERTKDKKLLEAAKLQVEAVMNSPRTTDGGIWARQEGPELWIDFVYAFCPFLAKYGLITGDKKYIDEAYVQFTVHAKHCVDAETGLARHCWCEKPNHFPQSMLWARGNGWMVAGGADLLALVPDHPSASSTKETVKQALQAMKAVQDRSGYLHHILDDPFSKLETSATLMYAYAAARAVEQGIVGKEFEESAKCALAGVAGGIGEDGAVTGVAVPPGGPGVQFGWTMFGQGFFLLAAHALRDRLGH